MATVLSRLCNAVHYNSPAIERVHFSETPKSNYLFEIEVIVSDDAVMDKTIIRGVSHFIHCVSKYSITDYLNTFHASLIVNPPGCDL